MGGGIGARAPPSLVDIAKFLIKNIKIDETFKSHFSDIEFY